MDNSCFFTVLVTLSLLLKCTTLCFGRNTLNSTTDQEALLAFKNNMIPESYGLLAGEWSTNTSVCDWIGVTCGIKHKRVTSLNLAGFNLTGTIAPHLGNLTFLRYLDISVNSLTGSIPDEMSNLRRLEIINLEYNFFTGEVPSWLGTLPQLQQMYLNNNTFTGSIPTSLFNTTSKLVNLDMGYNFLGGNVPQEIGNSSLLETINLEFNQFAVGPLPYGIFKVSSIKAINLRNSKLTGMLPSDICNNTPELYSIMLSLNRLYGEIPANISNCRYLQDLRLSNNRCNGDIPSQIGRLVNLKRLYLGDNVFGGELPQDLSNLANLEVFHVSNNRLMGPIPSSINNASMLTLLELSENYFSGPVPSFSNLSLLQRLNLVDNNLTGDLGFLSSLTNCPNLQSLDVSANQLSGILPTSIGNLSSTSLQFFDAAECIIRGEIPVEIGNLTSLLQLSLNSNQLTGFIPATLGKLKHLQGVYLNDNRLQGYIPPDLCKMSDLVIFYLDGNMLTGPIPECLGELSSLRKVHLSSNILNSTIPSSFWNLTDLLDLNLSSNHLSGQISSEIGSLRSINIVDLSWNQFSGDIPSSIGGSQTIEILYLGHNKLQGSIPKSLGNIINLRSLDLSNNDLSGVIPESLEGLRYLGYFNVSYNKLEGKIPSRGNFVNFTDQSFVQNSALCGETRFHVPLCAQNHTRPMPKSVSILLLKYILPPIISTIILVVIIIVLIRRRKHKKVPVPTDTSSVGDWRRISYQELVQGTSAFSEANLLGRGGFGSVFRGTLSDGLAIAIKVFNLQLEGASKSFDTESEILSTIRHRNLLRIIGCCCNKEFKSLILAYMPNGSLEQWLYSERYCLDILQKLHIAIDVALALEYLHHGHTFPIVHCDIKPSNVLLDEDMTAHVADFGLSKLFDEGEVVIQTKTFATIGYIAPEYGSEGKVSTNGDVYSYGILLLEMFTMKKPTDNMFSEEMSLKDWVSEALLQEHDVNEVVAPGLLIREDRYFSAKEQCVSSVFRLAMQCLAFSPEERINATQAVAALQKIKTIFLASSKMH